MAVLSGGYGSWQDHVGEDNRRKIRALDDRVAHLEARIEQLEAKLGDEADELVGEHGGDDESNAISADEMRRTVLLWAERFQPGDCWDTEDQRDLEAALTGTVEANPTRHQLRVLAEHDDTQQVREHTYRCAFLTRAERTEADLAAAQQQLDQVRRTYDAWTEEGLGTFPGIENTNWPDAWRDLGADLDAPARPAGHDETGQ